MYAAGLEHGVRHTRDGAPTPVTGEALYNGDDGVPVTTPEGPYWDRSGKKVPPRNDGDRSYGRITLHRALALSVNTPFMQLGMDTGLDNVRATAEAAGLLPSSIGAQVPALSTGQRHAQRDPHGQRLRHVRRRRHAHRAVLGAEDHP